jgi:hypothetical protein
LWSFGGKSSQSYKPSQMESRLVWVFHGKENGSENLHTYWLYLQNHTAQVFSEHRDNGK